ncbi:MAG: DUF7483 domain-containing protein, partial [Candidatus Margulisiibacteriota bacterium]
MKKPVKILFNTFLAALLFASATFAFSMNSGYYVGKGVQQSITGVGFKPDLVIIKADITGFAVFRTSAMGDAQGTAYFASAAENFANGITTLDNDGFTIGSNSNVNQAHVRYTWVAFKDTNSSDFKVGSYIGDNSNNRSITGIGFKPDLVVIKCNGAYYGCWKSSTMTGEVTQYFHNANQVTSGLILSLEADGFQIGTNAAVNSTSCTYWYIAFKEINLKVGSYTGDGSDDRSITGVGFKPDFVWIKGADNTTPQYGALRSNQSYGDESQLFSGSNVTNEVQSLEADGFQIGTSARVNENGKTYYYVAFSGVPTPPTPSGNFTMAYGGYLGTGNPQTIVSNLSFTPDLVIVKSGSAYYAFFSTSQMAPGYSFPLSAATGVYLNAITIIPNGFSVGTEPNVNASGAYYWWLAFGNSGSSNFKVGAYSGNGLDNRSIADLGFQPDLVVVRRNGGSVGCWRSSAMSGDTTAFFHNLANSSDRIQALETNGFQVGTNAEVNALNNTYFYFAFKETPNYFKVGSYVGNGSTQAISSLGGRPNWVWAKSSTTASYGFHKGINLGENAFAQYFINASNVPDRITALGLNSFTVGSSSDTNQSGTTYWYAAWLSSPTSLKFTAQPTGVEVGNPIVPPVKVAVVDQYGYVVDYDQSTQITLSLSSNPGGATLSGTQTKPVVSGEAVFNDLSLDKSANGYVLQASALGFSSVNSNPFNVGSGQGNKLSFITQPTTTPVGSIISPPLQVAVKDTLGNIVTSDNTSQITLALQSNPTGAVLSGTLTRTASQGVATFDDLSINLRGSGYTLFATAPYMQPATSEAFEVT